MSPKHFGHPTNWGKDTSGATLGGGWYPPGSKDYIGPADPMWGNLLDQARKQYGDPGIRFDTGNTWEDRHLVFSDGTPLPQDGSIVYRDGDKTWAQNDDGTASLVGPDGKPGPPVAPSGYRKIDDQYAPVGNDGRQMGPQASGVPTSNNGFFTDPKTGVLTPKNANGDYYTLGPDGHRTYFDKNGKPITADEFNKPGTPGSADDPGADGKFATDEQQSGRTATAIKELHDDLKSHYGKLSSAEETLSNVLLKAHATNAEGQSQLEAIQKKIIDAINDPLTAPTDAGRELSFNKFLLSQVQDIQDIVSKGNMAAADGTRAAQAISDLYAASPDTTSGPPQQPTPGTPAPEAPPAPADPGSPIGGDTPDPGGELGLGPAPQMPDPLTGLGMPGQDPFSQLASALPGALGSLGGLGGGGGSPLDSLGGLGGALGSALGPLAGLAQQNGDPGSKQEHDTDTSEKDKSDKDKSDKDKDQNQSGDPNKPPVQQQNQPGQPGDPNQPGTPQTGAPPAPGTPPAPPSSTVQIPGGGAATARNPAAAGAVNDYIGGKPLEQAYRDHGLTLPPPGTPVTEPVDPNRLTAGDVAVLKDRLEAAISSTKAYHNGQVVPLSTVTSSPDFLGWTDPTAAVTPHG